MIENVSGDFVKSLKEKIAGKKEQDFLKRSILQDSVSIIIDIFRSTKGLEIRQNRDFKISEVAHFIDVYSEKDFYETLYNAFDLLKIPNTKIILDDYKFLMIVNLGNKIVASGNTDNMFSLEVVSKRLRTYKIKISPCDLKFSYSVFSKGYYEIKYWVYSNSEIKNCKVNIKGLNRTEEVLKIKDELGNSISIDFLESGEVNSFKLFQKKTEKKNKN